MFKKFLELLEDIEDFIVIARRRGEPAISHEELILELKEDGLL